MVKDKIKIVVPAGTKKVGSFVRKKLKESGVNPKDGTLSSEATMDLETLDSTLIWTPK